ncbi:MAG: outer membrane protein assembly factor BamA, partial [Acidobacteriia bacterium]|nr:outer membrane protein assembly factor BamA [Terriglobia bacterium]
GPEQPPAPGQQPPQPGQPRPPQLETPQPAPVPGRVPAQPSGQIIESINFRGARRVPQDTLRAYLVSKPGDVYNEDTLRRDLTALWNTGRFEDISIEAEQGRTGVMVTFVVAERRVIRTIDYPGIHSVTVSEILDRFKERRVGLTVESQYDPNKVQRAAVVLKEFLAERGRQYATVNPLVEQIPPSSLKLIFNVNEGPKVKVGKIQIEGNKAFSQREVIRAMKNTHPIGIPYSIVLEGLFAKTYDADKLEEDKEMVRSAYQDKGYFTAKALDATVTIRRTGGEGWRLPLIKPNSPGIYADIKLPVEEGRLYKLGKMNYVGVKLFRAPETLTGALFHMQPGDVFSTAKLRDGLKNMRDLYGQFGYMDFVPEPSFDFPGGDVIDLTLTADEGKQFFVRRIEFSGNTTTRDKVIRREILLDEGDMFNSKLWEISLLRLNQLGYFQPLKKEDAADIRPNRQLNTVDITLKVQERGKNSIGLNGGVSGIAGSFIGLNYSTNNFLGLGETLSIESQLGTRLRSASFGFTEPYLFDKPIQSGFRVYVQRFNFNQAQQASILAGANLIPLYNQLGTQNLLNYTQNSYGFTLSSSYQLHRSFWRAGISFGYDISSVRTLTTAATNYFQYINFSGVSGPNALNGIRTVHVTPSYSYNTVNSPLNPTAGKSLFFSLDAAGSVAGGNVNTIKPAVDLRYFRPSPLNKKHVLAFHLSADIETGYGGKDIPPFSRRFIGGEQDVRGFQIWGITPIGFIPSTVSVNVLNADGSPRTQTTVIGGVVGQTPVTMTVPNYQLITPGGDATAIGNFEYRIPIVGPVTAALFFDAGENRILRLSQLRVVPSRIDQLNEEFPSAGFSNNVKIAPGTQRIRTSTGLEIQVLLPIVQAPFRVYFAYNPTTVREYLQPPVVADKSMFPNSATYNEYINNNNAGLFPFFEKRTLFRFTVGRTF